MSSKKGLGLAILAGVAIGVTVGVLAAPDKGSNTRKKIKGGYGDAKYGLKNKYQAAKDKLSGLDVEGTFDSLVSDLSDKKEDVVSFLESKLAALKGEARKM